jgi:TrmH family RNA methyltransferase
MTQDPRGPQLYRRSKRPAARPTPSAPSPVIAVPTATAASDIRRITSLSNDLIKDMRGLQSKKERTETGLFLAEGLKLVTDAFEAGWRVTTLAYCETVAAQPRVRDAIGMALQAGSDVIEVSEAVLEKISRRDNPQMVVSVIAQRFADLAPEAISGIWVALEGIKDPGNLGTIIRTVDSVGARGVILLDETTDPFALEAVRATMGSLFHVPIVRMTRDHFADVTRAAEIPVYGTHLKGAIDYRSIAYPERAILLMGNEQSGLPDSYLDICTDVIKIPMAGRADSLNLAIATGVALYEMRRKWLTV